MGNPQGQGRESKEKGIRLLLLRVFQFTLGFTSRDFRVILEIKFSNLMQILILICLRLQRGSLWKKRQGLPFGMLFSQILDLSNVESNGEEREKPKVSREYNQKTLRLMGFVQNEDDEWVKKAVATPSQEIQKEDAEEDEDEAEEEDPEEVEAVAEDRPERYIPVTTCPRTPVASILVSSGSHVTRLALLEASIPNLRDQLFSIHIDFWIGLEEI
ncbi:hypothetical protein CJ030_MR7G027937 [Morella rubra]|uniref:Uncharacterized protein n=1 Tax=Morella rubra TaxID=262757 RepID=A0A6A1V1G4_9ROSI|nr:hypothetical protein CJ030_MR7G027937 [Morella rubra]